MRRLFGTKRGVLLRKSISAVPPTISNIVFTQNTSTTGTITWTTNTASTSQVEYGLTNSYGTSTTLDPTLVTSHSVSLTGLTEGATYHYRVKSSGATSTDQTFILSLELPRVGPFTGQSFTLASSLSNYQDSQTMVFSSRTSPFKRNHIVLDSGSYLYNSPDDGSLNIWIWCNRFDNNFDGELASNGGPGGSGSFDNYHFDEGLEDYTYKYYGGSGGIPGGGGGGANDDEIMAAANGGTGSSTSPTDGQSVGAGIGGVNGGVPSNEGFADLPMAKGGNGGGTATSNGAQGSGGGGGGGGGGTPNVYLVCNILTANPASNHIIFNIGQPGGVSYTASEGDPGEAGYAYVASRSYDGNLLIQGAQGWRLFEIQGAPGSFSLVEHFSLTDTWNHL